ncbi:hypothetical protein LTS08_008721 [Lithohypha guttulata]|nr:hypothetical protein LTS08_008721 [Lithohypha guttulata]
MDQLECRLEELQLTPWQMKENIYTVFKHEIDVKTDKKFLRHSTALFNTNTRSFSATHCVGCTNEQIFAFSLSTAEMVGDTLVLRDDAHKDTRLLCDFPNSLVEGKDPIMRSMLLSLLACTDQMVHLHSLCSLVLEGKYNLDISPSTSLRTNTETEILSKIEEVFFDVRRGPRHWVYYRRSGNVDDSETCLHCTYRITMADGVQWALDLAGGQFGYHQNLMLWEDYEWSRIGEISYIVPFGVTAQDLSRDTNLAISQMTDEPTSKEMSKLAYFAQLQNAKVLEYGIVRGFAKAGLTPGSLLADHDKSAREEVLLAGLLLLGIDVAAC